MYKKLLILSSLIFVSVTFAQDSLYTTISGDTLTIHHDGTHRNCGASFTWDIEIFDNLIILTEVDTGAAAFCMCYFDLEVSLTDLDAGSYQIDIWGDDLYIDPIFYGSLELDWGVGLAGQEQSGCLSFREDTTYLDISILDDTLNLFWNTPLLNCGLEPTWEGWLTNDTFHVAMIDTGMPADCVCPFEVSASFGPFPPGTYTLDFWGGDYGYPEFTIAAFREGPAILGGFQSPCYNITSLKQHTSSQRPKGAVLELQTYPNPFNAEIMISYQIMKETELRIQIFNINGSLVRTLREVNRIQPGFYDLSWQADEVGGSVVGSGVYLLVFKSSEDTQVSRLLLLK